MNAYGVGTMVCVWQIVDGDAVAVVWQTDKAAAALIEEFTVRFGRPVGESTEPFDPTTVSMPAGVIMLYDEEPP